MRCLLLRNKHPKVSAIRMLIPHITSYPKWRGVLPVDWTFVLLRAALLVQQPPPAHVHLIKSSPFHVAPLKEILKGVVARKLLLGLYRSIELARSMKIYIDPFDWAFSLIAAHENPSLLCIGFKAVDSPRHKYIQGPQTMLHNTSLVPQETEAPRRILLTLVYNCAPSSAKHTLHSPHSQLPSPHWSLLPHPFNCPSTIITSPLLPDLSPPPTHTPRPNRPNRRRTTIPPLLHHTLQHLLPRRQVPIRKTPRSTAPLRDLG